MTQPTNHVKRHADRAREHMTAAQKRVAEIQQLADEYIADQQLQPQPVEVTSSEATETQSTTASS